LADGGRVDQLTVEALEALKRSGRRLIVVTGRRISDFRVRSPSPALREESRSVFPDGPRLVDRFIAENGGVIWKPTTDELRWPADGENGFIERLADGSYRVASGFVELLKARGVPDDRIWVGNTVVASRIEHLKLIQVALKDSGLDLKIDLNLDTVMISPRSADQVAALRLVAEELAVDLGDAIGIGDAEYDLPFLRICGRSVAVANAEPAVKEAVDCVTAGAAVVGIQELIQELI
jgi:hydroxymethylpyrimidine pyrophosphatase-like HAD family hydrolase